MMPIKNFNKNQKLGEIVSIFPKAADLFMQNQIDFCCGGDRTLEYALKEKGIEVKEILDQLESLYEDYRSKVNDEIDWRTAKYSDIIDFIENTHHAFMKKELPVTEELVTKILKVHFIDNGEMLTKVHKLFGQLKSELEMHLIKEEQSLFTKIKEYEKNPSEELLDKIVDEIVGTEDEHDVAGDILKELRQVTNNYEVPPTGCATFELTYKKIEAIESDLFRHIHLENNIMHDRLKKEKENR